MTRWKPDTCGCVLDVDDWGGPSSGSWDEQSSLWLPPTTKTHATCPLHRGPVDDAHGLVVMNGENRVKNLSVGDVSITVPDLFWSVEAARKANQTRLLQLLPRNNPRFEALIYGLSDEQLREACVAHGLAVISDLTPLPGVFGTFELPDTVPIGTARSVVIVFPQLLTSEKRLILDRHDRFGTGFDGKKKVTLK